MAKTLVGDFSAPHRLLSELDIGDKRDQSIDDLQVQASAHCDVIVSASNHESAMHTSSFFSFILFSMLRMSFDDSVSSRFSLSPEEEVSCIQKVAWQSAGLH